MIFNEVLVERLNKEYFPDNTDSVVLSLVPELDVVEPYIYTFRRYYADTDTHFYKVLRVYLVKSNTCFHDVKQILNKIDTCIKDAWKSYNTLGNKIHVQQLNWDKEIEIAIVEFEELDLIYNEKSTDEIMLNGTLLEYDLYYKASTKKYMGTSTFYLDGEALSVNMEYTSKPSKSKYIQDATDKFCEEYSVIIYEEG